MQNQLKTPVEAPKFWRRVSLKQGDKVILIEQFVEDFAPSRTLIREGGKKTDIEPVSTLGSIREKHLPSGAAACVVHLKDDLDVVFPDMDVPGTIKLHDCRYQQEFEIHEVVGSLANLQIEGVVNISEEVYLKNSGPFSDPYQREDIHAIPVTFKNGSEEALRSQLTDLFHAFPRIFDSVPEPRIFVYTEYDDHPASFNLQLYHRGETWQVESYFHSLVKPIIRENTPSGYRYRNGSGSLERRSEFHKDALLLSIEPTAPTAEEIQRARQNTTAKFETYGLTLNPQIFEQNPLIRQGRRPPGGKFWKFGKSAAVTFLVGLGLLESFGVLLQDSLVRCLGDEGGTCLAMLLTGELGIPRAHLQ